MGILSQRRLFDYERPQAIAADMNLAQQRFNAFRRVLSVAGGTA
jgi:hypothetical protein